MSNQIVYARVEQNQIIEYPVTEEQLRNRGATHIRVFKQVVFENKPTAKDFFRLEEVIHLVSGVPTVSYKEIPLTIQEILNGLTKLAQDNNLVEVPVSLIPQNVFERVVFLAREEVSRRLDFFAQTKFYDNIISLCTYATDPDEVLKAEGQRGVVIRSRAWTAIKNYEIAIATGTKPVPKSEAEIFAEIPVMDWED